MRKNILIFGHNDATQFIDIYNQYTRLFDRNKYAVTVVFLTGSPDEVVRKRMLAEEVIFLNLPKKKIRMLKISAIRSMLALCREKQFHLVICHRYKPSYIMLWVALWQKIPALIFVMHELATLSSLNRKMLIKFLNRKNMLFAGVSNAVRDDMRKSLPKVAKEQVATIYNMVDFDLTEPEMLSKEDAKAKLALPDDVFVFGNMARLAPNKDQHSLLQAFALIKNDCPRAKLLIIGDGILEEALKQKAKQLRIQDDVIFTGFLPAGFRYMRAFDAFVLTSVQEAFGRVLLEAMIAKLPIIATAVDGIPEVLGNVGELIKVKDVNTLAAAMKKVYTLSQQERLQWGEIAYQHALINFSIPAFQKLFWQLPLIKALED